MLQDFPDAPHISPFRPSFPGEDVTTPTPAFSRFSLAQGDIQINQPTPGQASK